MRIILLISAIIFILIAVFFIVKDGPNLMSDLYLFLCILFILLEGYIDDKPHKY